MFHCQEFLFRSVVRRSNRVLIKVVCQEGAYRNVEGDDCTVHSTQQKLFRKGIEGTATVSTAPVAPVCVGFILSISISECIWVGSEWETKATKLNSYRSCYPPWFLYQMSVYRTHTYSYRCNVLVSKGPSQRSMPLNVFGLKARTFVLPFPFSLRALSGAVQSLAWFGKHVWKLYVYNANTRAKGRLCICWVW